MRANLVEVEAHLDTTGNILQICLESANLSG